MDSITMVRPGGKCCQFGALTGRAGPMLHRFILGLFSAVTV
jgi:hypothetical protein